jgi:hypothetical protein
MDPGAKLQRPQPQQRGLWGNSPRSMELRGVGVVHRRPDGRSSLGASRGAKQGGSGSGRRAVLRAAPAASLKEQQCWVFAPLPPFILGVLGPALYAHKLVVVKPTNSISIYTC